MIEFQVWGLVHTYVSYAYKCVPLDIYVDLFAPLIWANLFHIHISWGYFFRPSTAEVHDQVQDWMYHDCYDEGDFSTIYAPQLILHLSPQTYLVENQECNGWGLIEGQEETPR